MGIRFFCPNGHKLNVKKFQAGRKGICPFCGAKIQIPLESTRPSDRGPGASPGEPAPGGTPEMTPGEGAEDDSPSDAVSITISAPNSEAAPAAVVSSPVPIVSAPTGPVPSVSSGVAARPAVDPLAEAGEVVWYVRPPSGGQFGPAGADIMRSWLAEGRISGDSLVWREGWRDWREASGVFAELRAQEAAAPSPVAETATADVATPVTHVTRPKAPRVRRTEGHPCCRDARCRRRGACGRLLLGLV